MNIAHPYFSIYNDRDPKKPFRLGDGIALLRKIEWAARMSHRSEDAQTEKSWERFLSAVIMSRGDWSVAEHASLTVEMYVDRGITHEIVRHRIASFTQESSRFVNYEKKMPPNFIYPGVRVEDEVELELDKDWVAGIEACEKAYKALIGKGWSPQLARSVLPNGLGSKIVMTCNLRNWRHFLLMRSTREAHPQMREVIVPLLKEMKKCIPLLYDDIEPEATQADNMKKMR